MNGIRVCNFHHIHDLSFTRESYSFGNEFLFKVKAIEPTLLLISNHAKGKEIRKTNNTE